MAEEKLTKDQKEIMEKMKKFANEVVSKYKDLIKSVVMMGSAVRGEIKPKSDIDVFVILDDTQFELNQDQREKIDDEIEKIAKKIDERISVQPNYTLTEFWDYARVAHPIIYNFIKEGIALYDTGFFAPLQKLLKMGKIPTTREAVENYMESAPKKLMRAKTVKLLMLAEDCYYAMLNTAQAVLMFMGKEPPVPSKAYEEIKKHLVDPGILEPEYAEWLKEIIEIRKKIEHKELTDVKGAFVDEWLEKAEKFVKKMFAILGALELRKKEEVLKRTYEVMYKAASTALKSLKIEVSSKDEIKSKFKEEFIDKERIDPYYWTVWNRVEKLMDLLKQGKILEIPKMKFIL